MNFFGSFVFLLFILLRRLFKSFVPYNPSAIDNFSSLLPTFGWLFSCFPVRSLVPCNFLSDFITPRHMFRYGKSSYPRSCWFWLIVIAWANYALNSLLVRDTGSTHIHFYLWEDVVHISLAAPLTCSIWEILLGACALLA